MKKILLLSVILLSYSFAQQIGVLIKKEGFVKVKHSHSIRKVSIKANEPIENGDTIYTYKAIAVIKLNDTSILKLTPYSEVSFNQNKVAQKQGEIYYSIHKRKPNNKLLVSTTFTTIGVKGTIFVVNSKSKNHSVALKKGLLAFKSLKGKYELHTKKLMNEFEKYKQKQNKEFKDYKNKLYKEFIEYKSSFYLKANKTVSFDGNKVYENPMDKNYSKNFKTFENNFKLSNFDMSKYVAKSNETKENNSTIIPKKHNDYVIVVRNPKVPNTKTKQPKKIQQNQQDNELNISEMKNTKKSDSFKELNEE